MDALSAWYLPFIAVALLFACLLAVFYILGRLYAAYKPSLRLERAENNPVLSPDPANWWESEAVFNPAAFVHGGKVHLLYRAIGQDGVSRIGYAHSDDGVHFTRSSSPAYDPSPASLERARRGARKYAPLSYDTVTHGSGGGWGGTEDPRAVVIDGHVCMTFTSFEGWSNVRMMLSFLPLAELEQGLFNWERGIYLSPPGEVQKNWVLFPEKIRGRYGILHNLEPEIQIAYIQPGDANDSAYIRSRFERAQRPKAWDSRLRGAGAPPLRTKDGWLLFYHAIDEREPHKYKVGAMLLDLKNPKKILHRSKEPVLEPDEWYENDWKPGVVYVSGAVIVGEDLLVYYGGGDKYVAAARANLDDFLLKLAHGQRADLVPVKA